ncbi:hypothetical protein A4X09_0g6718 [Tilletia walkeri]|uniref:Uncharacterized protein n=2 Tax=Tilletia TaxID=13289 RepID=A0A8X7N4V7_9BASI|nr:hypothetical protein A4X13_0g381 [Tilletia indica]KAE8265225.1 hypothetical protein A4X09_0g6718 [Tilletia walkeri]
MRFILAAATILGLASAAAAIDARVLVGFPTFCDRWNSACKAYKPTDPGLVFRGTLCEPGDYQGKSMDSEARVFCSFVQKTSPNGTATYVNKHIATQVGASFI